MVTEDFIGRRTLEVPLRDGTRVRLRPIRPDDKALLIEGMKHLSAESRYRRFFSPLETFSPSLLARLTEIDYSDHFAWIALALDQGGEPAVGVARYIRLPDKPDCAEIAVTVRDDYQGRGLGTLLVEALGLVAREHGIVEFTAIVLPENSPMRELLRDEGVQLRFDSNEGALRGTGPVPSAAHELRNGALYDQLRAAACGEVASNPP